MSTPQDPQGQQPGNPYQGSPHYGGYQQYGQEGGYPAGMYGQPYPGPQQVKRPGVLVVSVVLWVLTGLFLLLGGIGAALAGGSNQEVIQRQLDTVLGPAAQQIDPAMVQQAILVSGIVLAVLGVLLVVLPLLMLGRQNWARILLTVLGVLALLALLGTVIGPLVVLVAIVLHFLPPVNAWFKSRPRPA
jgi:hypothetical protein